MASLRQVRPSCIIPDCTDPGYYRVVTQKPDGTEVPFRLCAPHIQAEFGPPPHDRIVTYTRYLELRTPPPRTTPGAPTRRQRLPNFARLFHELHLAFTYRHHRPPTKSEMIDLLKP